MLPESPLPHDRWGEVDQDDDDDVKGSYVGVSTSVPSSVLLASLSGGGGSSKGLIKDHLPLRSRNSAYVRSRIRQSAHS